MIDSFRLKGNREVIIYADQRVKETNNENLRLMIDEMLGDLETTFNVKWIDCIYRLGPKCQESDRRPIMITFLFVSYKHQIYRNANKLKNINKWKGIYPQDDMSAPEQAEKKEIQAIYDYGKAQGLDVKMSGSNLIVDGVKYGPHEVLPHNLSIENAKTVKVRDGLAFHRTHSPHSNLHKCNFKYEITHRRNKLYNINMPRYVNNSTWPTRSLLLGTHMSACGLDIS